MMQSKNTTVPNKQLNAIYQKFLIPLPYFLGLYLVAILSTMAGMEIFGWLTALTVVILLLLNRMTSHKKIKASLGPDWAIIGFFILGCIGVFTNGLWETQGVKMIGSLRWAVLLYLIYFAIQKVSLKGVSEKQRKIFFNFLLFWALFSGLYGIIQFLTGIDIAKGILKATDHNMTYGNFSFWRTKGLFGMPLTYVYSYGMFTMILLGLFLRGQFNGQKRFLALIGIILLLGSIITTYARGGWLGILSASIIVLFLGLSKKNFLKVLIPLGAVVAGLIALTPSLRFRVFSIFDSTTKGATVRFDLWRANFEMFLDHPFFGVGYRQPGHVVKTYFEKLGISDGMIGGHAHSTYFEVLSGTGALGFICYAGFCLTFFVFTIRLWRKLRHESDSLAQPAENSSENCSKNSSENCTENSSPTNGELSTRTPTRNPQEIRKTHLLHSGLVLGALGAQIHFHVGGLTEAVFFDAEVNHMLMVIWAMVAYLYWLHFKPSRAHNH